MSLYCLEFPLLLVDDLVLLLSPFVAILSITFSLFKSCVDSASCMNSDWQNGCIIKVALWQDLMNKSAFVQRKKRPFFPRGSIPHHGLELIWWQLDFSLYLLQLIGQAPVKKRITSPTIRNSSCPDLWSSVNSKFNCSVSDLKIISCWWRRWVSRQLEQFWWKEI